jgi:hypothetical protein
VRRRFKREDTVDWIVGGGRIKQLWCKRRTRGFKREERLLDREKKKRILLT